MSEELDQSSVEFVVKIFQDSFAGVIAQHEQKLLELETALENAEKQIATLALGYGEQAVFMEALVAQMAFAGDQERKAFQENLTQARNKMLEVMRDASNAIVDDDDQRIASAIADLAEQKLSDSN